MDSDDKELLEMALQDEDFRNYCYFMLGYRIDDVRPCDWLRKLFDDWMDWQADISVNDS